MMIRIILLLVATLASAAAFAGEAAKPPPFDAGRYPADVQKALRYADTECKAQGGGEATLAPGTVTAIDLTGDRRDDYILQFGETECAAGRRAVYCGSGGGLINILVTLPNGRVRKVFDNYVRSYAIDPDPREKASGPRIVSFELHGAFCGEHGTPSCLKQKRITAAPFEFRMPK